jgi:carboxyl-terminal processing protease
MSVAVMRTHIVPQTVAYHREGNLAYIRLSGFNNRTTDSLRLKIQQAQNEIGTELRGYILDLRGNPGGLLEQAIAVSDVFVTSGRIVSTHGRHNDSHQYFRAKEDDLTDNAPLVALIDGGSASASEIVAAALQDSGRAVLVGSGSFGKGTVQTVLPLPNSGEFILTWARFHAPSGYALHRRGVLPDICTTGEVATPADVMALIQSGALPIAVDLRRLDIDTNDDAAIDTLRANCPAREGDEEIDLTVARQLLEEPGLYARALHGVADTAAAPAAGSGS